MIFFFPSKKSIITQLNSLIVHSQETSHFTKNTKVKGLQIALY